MEKITSINNSFIKKLLKLKTKKYRDEEKLFLIEGYHLVSEALSCNILKCVLIVAEEDKIENVQNYLVSYDIIKKLSMTVTPQKIIGLCSYFDYQFTNCSRYLLLDNIQDPGNLGTLIRSSLAFNVDLIIIGNDCVDIYNDKVIRSTQGSLFKVPFIVGDLSFYLKELKKNKVKIYGTSLSGRPLENVVACDNYALILGNEGNGVKKQLLEETDYNILIQTNSQLESLNVSVAGGIILFYFDLLMKNIN